MKFNWKIRILILISFAIIFLFLYKKTYFSFFALNLFLAYIPFELGNLIKKFNNKLIVFLIALLWFLYYPNAPYLVTDYVHIEVLNLFGAPFSSDIKSWLFFSLASFFIILGFSIGIISLVRVSKKLKETFFPNSNKATIIMIIIFSIFAGYGIYLGRFPRLHTMFLLENPVNILKIIIKNVNINSILFSFILSIWQFPFAILFIKKID